MKKSTTNITRVICIIFFLQIQFLSAAHSAVAIVAADSPDADFYAFLQLHPDLIPISQFETENLPSPVDKRLVLELFVKAKKLYLSAEQPSENPEIETLFRSIMERSRRDPWMKEMRSLFFDTSLYLATLEKDRAKRSLWLQEALKWRPMRILWVEWPNFIQLEFQYLFSEFQKQTPIKMNLWRLHPQRATLDGTELDVDSTQLLRVPKGEHRLIIFDDRHVPETYSVNERTILDLKWQDRFLALGTCDHPKVDADYEKVPLVVFYAKTCIWDKTADGHWSRWKENAHSAVADLSPSGYYQNLAAWPKPLEEGEHFYQKPTFWIGVIAVVVIAIKFQADQNRAAEPVRVAAP